MKYFIDLSAVLKRAWLAGIDITAVLVTDHNGDTCRINSPDYGYSRLVEFVTDFMTSYNALPFQMVFIKEGSDAKSFRRNFDRSYKANRDIADPAVSKANYEVHTEIQSRFIELMRGLGATFVSQSGLEGDDVLAFLCSNYPEDHTLVTTDRDLCALPAKNKHGAATIKLIDRSIVASDYNPFGSFPARYITLYKALVGDSSDNIKGIKGFGPKAWEGLWQVFGEEGCDGLIHGLDVAESFDYLGIDVETDPLKRVLYNGFADALKSWRCAKIYTHLVDSMWGALDWEHGLNKHSAEDVYRLGGSPQLAKCAVARRLATNSNFDKAKAHLMKFVGSEVAFDIETTTPEESDEWLGRLQAAGKGRSGGIDVMGATITGFSLTYGLNWEHSTYFCCNHKDTENIDVGALGAMLLKLQQAGVMFVIHNTAYEGPVCFNTWGEMWAEKLPQFNGLIANWLDTKFEASYVNENLPLGLKFLSKNYLNYEQQTYENVTTVVQDVEASDGPSDFDDSVGEVVEVQVKMDRLTGKEVLNYGCDDTICTAALHEAFKMRMALEGTWQTYLDVEVAASYLHVQSYIHGFKIDLAKLDSVKRHEMTQFEEAWGKLQQYLLDYAPDWPGCSYQPVEVLSPAEIKRIYATIVGEPLVTNVRTISKLCDLIEPVCPELAKSILIGDIASINRKAEQHFVKSPDFNIGSPVQKAKLLYEAMNLSTKVRNYPTAKQKAKDPFAKGSPKADNLAIQYGLIEVGKSDPRWDALQNLQTCMALNTRQSLFYAKYPHFIHWKTGRVHSSHNQCATNTRRASSSAPNMQQMSKHEKIGGLKPRIREVVIPHKRNAVIVSMDFASQELRVIADYSQDPAMLKCYVKGSNVDQHAMTGLGIYNSSHSPTFSFEEFMAVFHDSKHPLHKAAKEARTLGKKTNFTTEYGAGAAKLATTLLVSEEDAQMFIEAKEAAFPVATEWKRSVVEQVQLDGYVTTKAGGRRHLRDLLLGTKQESSKAQRQAVNFLIQGSSAEMTKLAEGRMWLAGLEQRFDCEIIGPIHDEVVASVTIPDLLPFCKVMHECMVAPYADMKVLIESSISFGKNFGEQIEIGNEPTEEAINEGLIELNKPAKEIA